MTRKFLDDVRAEINTIINDNTSGEISPADVRTVLTDMTDSLYQDETYLLGNTPTTGIPLTTAFQSLTTVFNTGVPEVPGFITPNIGAGTMTLSPTAGFSYILKLQITLDTSNNEQVWFRIGINGVPVGYTGAVIGGTGSRQISAAVEFVLLSAGPNDVITIMAAAPDGAASIDVESVFLLAAVLPTNNP